MLLGTLRARPVLAVLAIWAAIAGAVELPGVPVPPHYVLDDAELLNKADAAATEQVLMALRNDEGVPLVVMTIPSVATYGAEDVEELASKILRKWTANDPKGNWTYGGLILVAKSDRKARIQLGVGHQHTKDSQCDLIMEKRIVAKFKAGGYSTGVRGGAEALAALLGSGSLPLDVQPAEAGILSGPKPAKVYSNWDVVLGLVVIIGGAVLGMLIIFWVGRWLWRACLSSGRGGSSSSYDTSSTSYYDSSSSSSYSSSDSSSSSSSSSDGGGSTGSW